MTPADLVDLGLKLFPVSPHKRPLMVGWQRYAVNATLDSLRNDWCNGVRAFGIYLRPSRIVAFDADNKAADAWAEENLPHTPMMTLTKRGSHRFYRLPEGVSPPKDNRPVVGVALDRKAKGYVIAPGSSLGGFVYKEQSFWDTPIGELPEYPIAMFPERIMEPCRVAVPDINESDVTYQIIEWFIANSEDSIEGQGGSRVLKKAASFFVNGLAIPHNHVGFWLDEWNKNRAKPEWSLKEINHAIETSRIEGASNGRPRGWAYTDWAKR
jgi:hypothetical protein